MVHHREAVPVEGLAEQPLGQGHADRVGESLAQGTGGGFDPGALAELGVAGGGRVELAERLDVVDGDVVTGQMQRRVEQHRAMAVGQHEPVAIGPAGVAGVVAERFPPQHLGHVGEPHGRTGMAGIGGLDRVHGERTNGVRSVSSARHRVSSASRWSRGAAIVPGRPSRCNSSRGGSRRRRRCGPRRTTSSAIFLCIRWVTIPAIPAHGHARPATKDHP